jgi:cytochrome c-type biogenesis protein CcmH
LIIWLWMLLLALLAMLPLAFAWRGKGLTANRRDAAMALHQSQLDEIERDRAEGRLPEEEYRAARLEVQRRLLATDAIVEATSGGNARGLLILVGVLVPVVALVLFLPGGLPLVPSEPHASWVKQQDAAAARDNRLIAALRARLAQMNPDSPEGREGYVILGQALLERGRTAAAAKAWLVALQAKFDPTLAAETAELEIDTAGHMTPNARALFTRALAEAPRDAPWRGLVKQRLREASVTLPNASTDANSKP